MKYLARNYYECEKGRRWSETVIEDQRRKGKGACGKFDYTVKKNNTKDGDFCKFSGCPENDHKVKLVKSVPWERDEKTSEGHYWFRGYNDLKKAPTYMVLRVSKISH